MELYGRNWAKVQQLVPTRSITQCREHASVLRHTGTPPPSEPTLASTRSHRKRKSTDQGAGPAAKRTLTAPLPLESLGPVLRRAFHAPAAGQPARTAAVPVVPPLTPNSATIPAFSRLLDGVAPQLPEHSDEGPPVSRQSPAYQSLFNRFRALFFWPSVLSLTGAALAEEPPGEEEGQQQTSS